MCKIFDLDSRRHVGALWTDERGQNMTEYGLLLVLIAIAAVAAVETLGNGIVDVWDRTRDMLGGNTGNGGSGT